MSQTRWNENGSGTLILRKQGGKCFYCEEVLTLKSVLHPKCMTVDHIIPKARGGANSFNNYVVACQECNRLRSDTDILDFKEYKSVCIRR